MAVDQQLLCLASLFGFIPAVVVLYFIPGSYERLFEHRRLIALFAVGMVLGMIAFALHAFIDDAVIGSLDTAVVIFVLAFPLLETLMKLSVVNWKKLQGDHATVFYGVSVGTGFGATAVIGYAALVLRDAPDAGLLGTAIALGTVGLYATGSITTHAGTGLLLGAGSARRETVYFGVQAFVFQAAFNALFLAVLTVGGPSIVGSPPYLLPLLPLYGVILLIWLVRNVLPKVLPAAAARARIRQIKAERRGRIPRSARTTTGSAVPRTTSRRG